MKILLILVCCILCVFAKAQVKPITQQKLNTFHIVDSVSKTPIATSVTVVRAKLFITTEKDGVFIIPGNLEQMRDTVIFNSQNYEPLKTTLRHLSIADTIIRLKKRIIQNTATALSFKNDTLLNDFNWEDVAYYAGVSTNTEVFNYKQLAQKFTIPKPGTRLKRARIVRFAPSWTYELHATKFHLRVYDIDPKTGGPGKDLCDSIIEVSSGSESSQSTIALKKYNIIILNKSFFIAIEWMRDIYNAAYAEVYDAKLKKFTYLPHYKPEIGISPIQGKSLNIWSLNLKGEWKPYTYFMPFGTDLAIKAVVEY